MSSNETTNPNLRNPVSVTVAWLLERLGNLHEGESLQVSPALLAYLSRSDLGQSLPVPATPLSEVDALTLPGGLFGAIYDTLREYTCTQSTAAEGAGYPLIDALTPEGRNVDVGIDECEHLADAIYASASKVIVPLRAAAAAAPAPADTASPDWQLVPCQHTPEMEEAWNAHHNDPLGDLWGALLEAARKSPAPGEAQSLASVSTPELMADFINRILEIDTPKPASRENGWFGGYGCRWCSASQAWFTVVPFGVDDLVKRIATAFRLSGCRDVSVGYEGGVSALDGGRGIQISAYV